MTEQNVLRGPAIENVIPFNLGELMLMMLETHQDKVLQVDAETREEITASYIAQRSKRIARWLQSLGLKPNDSVGIMSENRLEFCLIPCAAFFAGFTLATYNPTYSDDEFVHTLNLAKPSVIFCSPSSLNRVVSATGAHPFIKHIVVFGNQPRRQHNMVTALDVALEERFLDALEDEDFIPAQVDTEENVATILCSSGTTGMPKGVLTTQYNMLMFFAASSQYQSTFLYEQVDVTMGITPFFHSMGLMTMLLALLGGKKSIVMKKFNFKLLLQCIQDFKVKLMAIPPPIIIALCESPLIKEYDLSSLKVIRCGAAPLPVEFEKEISKQYKLISMNQGYGMTETTFGVCLLPSDSEEKKGSVGKVIPGMSAKVIDENGKALGPNCTGEMCFKGPIIMKGYVNDPVATANTIDSEGWLHTGDVGYYDNDGYIFIVDRIKELIKYKAFQVPPAELEALLLTHPGVMDAAVIGLPDNKAGELPLAFIVRNPGVKVTAEELQEFVKGKVSSPKHLRGGVRFIEAIPRNPSGKILRRVLKETVVQNKSKL